MQHDYKWFGESIDGPSHHCEELAIDLAKEYLEHWISWRKFDEQPELGDRIEILEQGMFGDAENYFHIFNNNMPENAVAWRPSPLGALPDGIIDL